MPDDVHTGDRNSSLRQRLCHWTGLEKRDHFILELVAIHRRDQIDQAALGATGVETCDQMTNSNRQDPEPLLGQNATPLQEGDDVIGQIFCGFAKSVQDQFRRLRPLVR